MISSVKVLSAAVIAVVFLFGACNFVNQMRHAQQKEFWLDEKFELNDTVKHPYLGLLTKSSSEANPAPLDYIFTKLLDEIKPAVASFGLSDKVYYRLGANFWMVFCGVLIVFLFALDILRQPSSNQVKILQLLLLLMLPLLYLYRPMTYHYAAEMRPYSLWFALWVITAGFCSLFPDNKPALTVVLSLLAATMVASIFQILAVGIAYVAVQWRRRGLKQALINSLQVFSLPLILVIYYSYPASYGDRALEPAAVSWQRFLHWWRHEMIIVPMLLAGIILLYQSKQDRGRIIGPLAVLIVFLMGPAILGLTLKRGYFFTERQYIYYDAHRAVFWLAMINGLPFYLEKIKDKQRQTTAIALIFLLWLPFVFTKKTVYYLKLVAHPCFESTP